MYAAEYYSTWRWHKAYIDLKLFTGVAASDHHPVVATFATAPPRRATKIEAKIPIEVFDDPEVREMINLLWRRIYSAPEGDDDRDKLSIWTEVKTKVSSILLAKAVELRRRGSWIPSVQS